MPTTTTTNATHFSKEWKLSGWTRRTNFRSSHRARVLPCEQRSHTQRNHTHAIHSSQSTRNAHAKHTQSTKHVRTTPPPLFTRTVIITDQPPPQQQQPKSTPLRKRVRLSGFTIDLATNKNKNKNAHKIITLLLFVSSGHRYWRAVDV